jgi:hypothetical protein
MDSFKQDDLREAQDALAVGGSISEGARLLGISRSSMQRRLKVAQARPQPPLQSVHVDYPASPDEPLEDLINRKKAQFGRGKAHKDASELIHVKVKERGPFGILVFGDPHIDNDGCDITALERDLDVITAPTGIYGLNLGDLTDNWVGRLARLYAESSTKASDGVRLMEWMLKGRRWLAVLGGNHDGWQGTDLIQWMLRQGNSQLSMHGVRLQLNFPKGDPIRIHARHDFRGHSMYNPTHGLVRETREGYRDHLLLAGHRHIDHYQILPHKAAGFPMHMARVSGYKILDGYADELGLHESRLAPSVCFVIQPEHHLPVERIKPFWDALEAEAYLKWLRTRAA